MLHLASINNSVFKFLKNNNRYYCNPTVTKQVNNPYRDSKNPERSIEKIESEIKYPLKLIGTRKPGKWWFWAWDLNFGLIRDKINPYLYLTFEDSKGQVIGPIRYHSELIGWGPKIELSSRIIQFGKISGVSPETTFYELPKKIEATGMDISFGIGLCCSHYSKIKLQNNDIKLQYIGVGSPVGLGFVKISRGLFEAEDFVAGLGCKLL